jgi:hypothetical protein
MRHLLIAAGIAACLGMSIGAFADEPKMQGGGGGGGVGAKVEEGAGGAAVKIGEGARIETGPRAGVGVDVGPRSGVNVDVDRGRRSADVDVNRGRVNVEVNRNRTRIGDRDFDRRGIGTVDMDRYRRFADRDNSWRYRRLGNEWWYWVPGNYWMFYRDGRWNRYDVDTYTEYDAYPSNADAQPANFSGPYYEDSNGFYYVQGGRRIYDPQIQRVASAAGPVQR